MYKLIDLGNKKYSIIDSDMEHLNEFKWFCSDVSYAVRTLNDARTRIHLHRVIMGVTDPKISVDHINGNTLDNRKCNLRLCNNAENSRNKRKRSNIEFTSKYKGVDFKQKENKWRAQISVNRKKINLGDFKTEKEAADAYDIASLLYHENFANNNKTVNDEIDISKYQILPRADTFIRKYRPEVISDCGKKFITISEAAKFFNVKENTIIKAITDTSMVRRVRGRILKYGEWKVHEIFIDFKIGD